jgi:hypothetical protein
MPWLTLHFVDNLLKTDAYDRSGQPRDCSAPEARHVLKSCPRIADFTASDPKQHFAVTCIISQGVAQLGLWRQPAGR